MKFILLLIMLFFSIVNLIIELPKIKNVENRILQNYFPSKRKSNKQKIIEFVDLYAKIYNLDRKMMLGIIDLESSFNPREKNKLSSAYGAGQFIRGTGEWMYKQIYPNKEYDHYNTTIQEQIHMIAYYLKYLSDKYDENKRLILREYSGNSSGYYTAYLKRERKYKGG